MQSQTIGFYINTLKNPIAKNQGLPPLLTKPLCIWHALLCTQHYLKLHVATPKSSQSFLQLNIANVTQVVFAFIQHTLEAQISCLHVGLNLTIGKELFNESRLHIIFHPFYTQHCVGKTWKGWSPTSYLIRPPVVNLASTCYIGYS